MTRLISLRYRVLPIALALGAGASCLSTACFAQSAPVPESAPAPTMAQPVRPSTGDTIRLTDEQRDAILNNNTVESAAAARGELRDSEIARPGIHGEVGVMIGSQGARGVYGTADIPLGENAGATVSFESSSFGHRR
jgi:hypothetical protein